MKSKRCKIILGAGGHAKEVADLLTRKGFTSKELYFFDNVTKTKELFLGAFNVISEIRELTEFSSFFLGVGGSEARRSLVKLGQKAGLNWSGLRAASSIVGAFQKDIHDSVDILERAVISSGVKISEGTLVNRGVSIHHDVKIGEYCEIAPMVTLLGGVVIGHDVFIGSGATVLPNVKVGNGAVIGAGALVKDTVIERTTVVGNPARVIKRGI